MNPALERSAPPMKPKKKFTVEKCDFCKGKGTVKVVIDQPGKFEVGLCVSATFKLKWNDASESTAKQVEQELRGLFTRKSFADLIDEELNTAPQPLKYKLELKVKKLK
jgi:hypothetical protein